MSGIETIAIALIGGLVPSLVWLGFWLLEDRCEPEPRYRILLTFLAGMACVALVLPLEQAVMPYASGGLLLFMWAAFEESLKLGAAAIFGLASRDYDEPLDAIVYMATAALGFAAAENALFLWNPLHTGQLAETVVTGDLRFIGATLLHTLSSVTIGLCMAFAYYKNSLRRKEALIAGLVLAILLHTIFNFLILQGGGDLTFSVFATIWAGIVATLFLLERIKHPARDYC